MKNKMRNYLILLLTIILLNQLHSFLHIRYLREWPEQGMGMMSSISYFTIKHFWGLIIQVSMGMVFGAEVLISDYKKSGLWQIDTQKLLILGLPLLLLSFEYVNFVILNDVLGMGNKYLTVPAREPYFRFALGYVIATSIKKRKS